MSENEDRKNIAKLLKSFREQNQLSIQRFARESGLSRAMVLKLEKAATTPTVTTLRKLAKVCGMTLTELIRQIDGSSIFYKTRIEEVEKRVSKDGSFISFPVSSRTMDRNSEVFEFHFIKVGEHQAVRPEGAVVGIFVRNGELELEASGESLTLYAGDFVQFRTSKSYTYRQLKKRKLATGSVFIRYS